MSKSTSLPVPQIHRKPIGGSISALLLLFVASYDASAVDAGTLAVPNSTAPALEIRGNGMIIGKPLPGSLLTSDTGDRFLWHSEKFALRLGYVDNTLPIGWGSVAFGNSYAQGTYSFAAGVEANAAGYISIAMGEFAYAEGVAAVALGAGGAVGDYSFSSNQGSAEGTYSAALNTGSAVGYLSNAFGESTRADGRSQTVIGRFNVLFWFSVNVQEAGRG